MISDEELNDRREVLCGKYDLIRDFNLIFRVPEEYRDDLLQDTFIIAYNNIGKVRNMEKLNSWLYKISYRNMTRYISKQRRLHENEILFSDKDWEREIIPKMDHNMTAYIAEDSFNDTQLNCMVMELQPPAPQIIWMRFIEGFNLKEIAEILNINYNTVKTIERRAFKKLQNIIEENQD